MLSCGEVKDVKLSWRCSTVFVFYDHINYFMLGIEIITIDQHTSVTLGISIN